MHTVLHIEVLNSAQHVATQPIAKSGIVQRPQYVSRHGDIVAGLKAGANDYLTKPIIDDDVRLTVERSLRQQNLLAENRRLKAYIRDWPVEEGAEPAEKPAAPAKTPAEKPVAPAKTPAEKPATPDEKAPASGAEGSSSSSTRPREEKSRSLTRIRTRPAASGRKSRFRRRATRSGAWTASR